MLYDTALSLQKTFFAETEEAETALEKVENILFLFERHAEHEDTFVLPAITAYEPQLVDDFEKEHVTDLALCNKLKNLITIYRNCNFTEERINAGSAITKSFIDFMIFNLEHMGKEEIYLNKVLWDHYTDEQLHELSGKIVASIPAEEMALTSKWMVQSINSNEAIIWLKEVKKTAPVFVLQNLLAAAENSFAKEHFIKIQESLGDEAMIA